MKAAILLAFTLFAISHVLGEPTPKFVSYVGLAGSTWGGPDSNADFLKAIGVPGYGGSKGYNVLNFAFWVSSTSIAAVNGAAHDWETIELRIRDYSLRTTLTGTANPTGNQLRTAIKALYASEGIEIFISAFGGADHPMGNGNACTSSSCPIADNLAAYASTYQYDGVDVDWEEAISGWFGASTGGEAWLCAFTNRLRSRLNSNQKLTHAPQAPYFMGAPQYPNGGYNTVHKSCGSNIDWYNVQFYNQGSTGYNTFNVLFKTSNGWSGNTGVYQIMEGRASENAQVPASKIVVGKHTAGDGSSYVSGNSLKTIFLEALAEGRWNGGFMSWQFYHEVYPPTAQGAPLIDSILDAWNMPTTPRAPTAPTSPPPTTPTIASDNENIAIVNFGDSTMWFYSARYPVSGITPGYSISKFEIQMSNGVWHTCDVTSVNYKCQSLTSSLSLPFSVRLTANNGDTLTGTRVISSFTNARVYDFGSNFASVGAPSPVRTPAPVRAPVRTPEPVRTPAPNNGGGSGSGSRITVINREGCTEWWYTVTVSGVPNGVSIEYVKMKHSGSDWETGVYYQWGNYYGFNINTPFRAPFSFQIGASNGQVITRENAMSSWAAGNSVEMGTLSSGYNMEDDSNDSIGWTVWFAIFVVIMLCLIGTVAGFFFYKKRMKSKGKAYFNNKTDGDTAELREGDGNNTVQTTEMIDVRDDESEAEIEVEIEAETYMTNQ